ncbi:MAG TPA: GNAT family N-acetyltransferase [Gaiellaceae bacterium]|nr:GNAT family N-acetyltransferase [Gaiellaceae bacterium]
MWAGYCDFYGADVPEEITAETWRRILDPASRVGAVLAVLEAETVGFANFVLHPFTWSELPACLLEDLYVAPAARGRGIGRLLIEHLVERARSEGWARVYWHTRAGNTTARRLYDRFCPADGFVRYTIALEGPTATAGEG